MTQEEILKNVKERYIKTVIEKMACDALLDEILLYDRFKRISFIKQGKMFAYTEIISSLTDREADYEEFIFKTNEEATTELLDCGIQELFELAGYDGAEELENYNTLKKGERLFPHA